ncbi:hypothetical protein [Magnetococcus sp. PR-3]|uniref:hypothetical protein n=1 Tax=Magnetococcus sp. PR-3 TaxID=3120355 RepID=UPI002FCE0DD7
MNQNTSSPRFLLILMLVLTGLLGGTLGINLFFDPLWHAGGNQLRGVNYAFNERYMVLNRLKRVLPKVDCILFGSSRATLLDSSRIPGQRCVNISFSNGHVREFLAITRYLKRHKVEVKRLIFSVNEVSFLSYYNQSGKDLPDYIENPTLFPSMIKDYTSWGGVDFSWRTFRGRSPLPRAYQKNEDGEYTGFILPWALNQGYHPSQKMAAHPALKDAMTKENLALYEALLNIYPQAKSMGIVMPVSDWEQARMSLLGNLSEYLEIRHALSRMFSQGLVDFSIPSPLTRRVDITYDGLHYDPKVLTPILDHLSGRPQASGGTQVKALSLEVYQNMVERQIKPFIQARALSVSVEPP